MQRKRLTPVIGTRLRLFASAGGRCQNPECSKWLFLDSDGDLNVAEGGHIVSVALSGPRGDETYDNESLRSFDNLILLCPTCHATIDAIPDDYPETTLQSWKDKSAQLIDEALGVRRFESRAGARAAVEYLISENRVVWELLGPDNEYKFNPESTLPDRWREAVVGKIIPNNRAILKLAAANDQLLTNEERSVIARLRIHADHLEIRHLDGKIVEEAQRWPGEAKDLFI